MKISEMITDRYKLRIPPTVYYELLADVQELEDEQEPRWIPVSERLPKAGEYVGNVAKYYLVQNEHGDMMVARYTHSEYWEEMYHFNPIADEVIAWRELPQSYEAESEEV